MTEKTEDSILDTAVVGALEVGGAIVVTVTIVVGTVEITIGGLDTGDRLMKITHDMKKRRGLEMTTSTDLNGM